MIERNCFIKKNTKKLRHILRNFGYLDNTCFTCFDNFLYTLYGDYYTCRDYKKFSEMRSKEFINECIDCGTNETLFLAIAALKDNTDFMQLFTDGTHWTLSYADKFEKMPKIGKLIDIDYSKYHKATVKELIEHFK